MAAKVRSSLRGWKTVTQTSYCFNDLDCTKIDFIAWKKLSFFLIIKVIEFVTLESTLFPGTLSFFQFDPLFIVIFSIHRMISSLPILKDMVDHASSPLFRIALRFRPLCRDSVSVWSFETWLEYEASLRFLNIVPARVLLLRTHGFPVQSIPPLVRFSSRALPADQA